jgi:hypothetical protein
MNIKFRWLMIAISGVALAAPLQADPHGNRGNHGPAARPAPSRGGGPSLYRGASSSYRPVAVPNYGGARNYSTGPRFSSVGIGQGSTFRQQRFQTSNFQSQFNTGPTVPGTFSRGARGFDRTRTSTATGGFQSTGGTRTTQFSNVNNTTTSTTTTQNHVFAQRSADWQPTWDRNRDHWWRGHRCRFVNNSWFIFDFGFYPWGYGYGYPYSYGYPYDYGYGYDYYPYDYGYDSGYYGAGQYYGQGQYYGDGQYYGQDEYYGQDGYSGSDQYDDSPVAAAQDRLARQGYYRGRIDGNFGPETRRAVMAFQRDHGLTATGYLTRDTRAALGLRP